MSNPLKKFLRYCFPNRDVLSQLAQLKELIEMNQAELKAALDEVSGGLTAVGTQLDEGGVQLEKATNEIVLAIQNAGATSPEVDAAVVSLRAVAAALTGKGTAIKSAAQTLDDLNVDQTPVP